MHWHVYTQSQGQNDWFSNMHVVLFNDITYFTIKTDKQSHLDLSKLYDAFMHETVRKWACRME